MPSLKVLYLLIFSSRSWSMSGVPYQESHIGHTTDSHVEFDQQDGLDLTLAPLNTYLPAFGLPQEQDLINPVLMHPYYHHESQLEYHPKDYLTTAQSSTQCSLSNLDPDTSLRLCNQMEEKGSSTWFKEVDQRSRYHIASLLAHYWTRRFKKGISKSFYNMLNKCITPEIGNVLLNPDTPIDYLIHVINGIRGGSGSAYAQSIYDVKALISEKYGICRKTLDRYVDSARCNGLDGAPANLIYDYCTEKWNLLNGKRSIQFDPYSSWQPEMHSVDFSL